MKCYIAAKKIVTTLQEAGFIAYFAGGWVRDHILGKDADDIDIATTATPEQTMKLFPKTIPVGINFSILIVVQDNVHCEVATFRQEDDYEDGRRPGTVVHASPEEDAKRRDFTINGMFFDPVSEKLYDFVGGKEDLEKGILRAIGDPHHRFAEDRLRMIRACRYSARFGFEIDKNTAAAITAHASELFPAVAIERIYDEFKKMTRDPHLFDGLLLLHKFGILSVIFKDLPLISYEELKEKLLNPPNFPEHTYPMIYLYELIKEPTLKEKIQLCKHFKVSNKEIKFTEELEKWEHASSLSSYELAVLYSHSNSHKCEQIAKVHANDKEFDLFHKSKRESLKAHIERLQTKSPLLSSLDLKEMGIKPGKELGALLQKAAELAINNNLSSKEEVIRALDPLNNSC